ncbi:MAG: hypothetical protein H8E14_00025 [Candidatus Marinimicrobia bacterium]|nr:hypothetical protein [Candidatus Neomarinimicrobiota bacterium]
MRILKIITVTLATIILITAFSFSYYLHSLKLEERLYLNDKARINFLIVSDASKYKDELRTEIITHYSNFCNIKVINIHNLKFNVSELYDIILIMDTCLACEDFNRPTKRFLDVNRNTSNIVLLMTASDPREGFQYAGIDAISAASRIKNTGRDYLKIRSEIDNILKQVN